MAPAADAANLRRTFRRRTLAQQQSPEQRPKGADFPVHALAAFERIHLDAGQSQAVSVHVPLRRLECWSSAEGKWIKATGAREVLVGGSSRDLPLSAKTTIQ